MEDIRWLLKLLFSDTTILGNLVSNVVKLFVQPPLKFVSTIWKVWTQRLPELFIASHDQYSGIGSHQGGLADGKLSKEEVEMVMRRLGICYVGTKGGDNDSREQNIVGEELKDMFEEEEPNLEEVKQAFDVFDEDRDGFIDAADLQRVLWRLGLVKDSGISKCVSMIKAVDMNEDGMIDFNEFVRFMENC